MCFKCLSHAHVIISIKDYMPYILLSQIFFSVFELSSKELLIYYQVGLGHFLLNCVSYK